MKYLVAILKYVFISTLILSVVGTLAVTIFLFYFGGDIPQMYRLEDYKPALVTSIYDNNNHLMAEYFEQRRYLVNIDEIPEKVSQCFLAAEDDRFFHHQGVDYLGILRAALVNIKAGHVVQGGSTITQQVAKSILATSERSFHRKVKEFIVASKLEKNLTKRQILQLYLNQIYFGEGSYGIEAAARTYFHKNAKDLSLAEAAILAGLPQAPSRYSPLHNPKRAKERQVYVLNRMAENGWITAQKARDEMKKNVRIYYFKLINDEAAPYYSEYIRRYVLEKYGKEALYQGGLIVKVSGNIESNVLASRSLQDGLRHIDKRFGYRGPLATYSKKENLFSALEKIRSENLMLLAPFKDLSADGSLEVPSLDQLSEPKPSQLFKGIVTQVSDAKQEALIDLGMTVGRLKLEDMKWAAPARKDGLVSTEIIKKPSQALKIGDVVLVKITEWLPKQVSKLSLEQIPEVQGSLVSINNETGEVETLVGGYDSQLSEFNRVTQAERQPGSAFKPFIYAAAIDRGYTPATVIQDSPLVFSAGEDEKWKPLNYNEKFSGDTTFRSALIHSMNIPTIKILQDIGIPYILSYAKKIGFKKPLNPDYSLALGSFSISLLDLTSIYTTFPRLGKRVEPVFIREIKDRTEKTLESKEVSSSGLPPVDFVPVETESAVSFAGQVTLRDRQNPIHEVRLKNLGTSSERVMDPRTAYVMTHLMTEVATEGTGMEARNLKRSAAGKTGTTNDYVDAWFIGYIPQVTTGVWVGFDTLRTLGKEGTGGHTALPIWLSYMQGKVSQMPVKDFDVPPGVSFSYIHPGTGRLISGSRGGVKEAFISGTEPSGRQSQVDAQNLPSNSRAQPSSQGGTSGPGQEESSTGDFLKEDFQ